MNHPHGFTTFDAASPASIGTAGTSAAPPVTSNTAPASVDPAPALVEKQAPATSNFRQNFETPAPYLRPTGGTGETTVDLAMPSARREAAFEALNSASGQLDIKSPGTEDYVEHIGSVSALMPPKEDMLNAAIDRSSAHWTNEPKLGEQKLRAGYVGLPANSAQMLGTPEVRTALVRSALKLGNWASIPLWHSGMWLTINAPSEGELLELNRKIAEHRVGIGRSTFGLMYSAENALTNYELARFAIDHLYESNMKDYAGKNLFDFISVLDLPLIIHGLASTIWPSGFRMRRLCVADPASCRHEVVEQVNLSRMVFTDTTRFTETQVRQMAERARGSVSADRVLAYQADGLIPKISNVKIEDLVINFRVPNLTEYFASGMQWASDIEAAYGSSLGFDERKRAESLEAHSRATRLRNFAHNVASVQVGDHVLSEQADINATLDAMCASDNHVEKFTNAVKAFMNNAVSSLVAIPTYDCPSCGKPQPVSVEGSPYPELIPIDPGQVFFFLLHQKLSRYQAE